MIFPYKEGYFRHGMYLGPEETQCAHIFMDDIIEDICHYIPSMDKHIERLLRVLDSSRCGRLFS